MLPTRSGGQVLIDILHQQGVDTAYCVPGESYLAALDALYGHPIRLITCRNEGGAAFMAEAYGKMTNRPGICFVTRGPGATNACIGVHTAYYDATPMILFIGQVSRDDLHREAFQEIDFVALFKPMTKWAVQIDDAKRLPELISRAFYVAQSGRPGPVVIILPEDMLRDHVAISDTPAYCPLTHGPDQAALNQCHHLLSQAKNPLVIIGGNGWTDHAWQMVQHWAERNHLPVATAFRCQDRFDNFHPCYIGHLGINPIASLATYVQEADVLCVIGSRLDDITTSGYQLMVPPRSQQKLIHIYPDPNELGRVYQPDLGICATVAGFSQGLETMPEIKPSWQAKVKQAHQAYLDSLQPIPMPGPVNLAEIINFLAKELPDDSIITNGAGNYAAWVHRFFPFRKLGTQLAPTNGAMGYGMPAAVAAQLHYPKRRVVCFAGDGCFMMNGQELATAVRYNAPVVTIVVNNNRLGTIRMHQEKNYPTRVVGTELTNPDFAEYAKSFGAHGEVVTKTADFKAAWQRAVDSNKPAVIELRIDPDALSPTFHLNKGNEHGSC